MPHLHLSVQAGDDLILKRMKRRHGRDDVLRLSERLRRLRPEIAFGADLIAGFPTESEAMFGNTLAPDRRGRSGLSARVSLLGAQRHAGRAHAAGAEAGAQGARRAVARRRRAPARGRARGAGRPARARAGRRAGARPHRGLRAVPLRRRGAARGPGGRGGRARGRGRGRCSGGRRHERDPTARLPRPLPAARRGAGRRAPRTAPATAADEAARASWYQRLRAGLGRSSSRLKDNIGRSSPGAGSMPRASRSSRRR